MTDKPIAAQQETGESPYCYLVEVLSTDNAYVVYDENDAAAVDDLTNHGARLVPLFTRPPIAEQQFAHPTIEQCAMAGRGSEQVKGGFSEGGFPDTLEERSRFEAYMMGHCWYIGKYDESIKGYDTTMVRMLYGVWRDRGWLSSIAAQQAPCMTPAHSSGPERDSPKSLEVSEHRAAAFGESAPDTQPAAAATTFQDIELTHKDLMELLETFGGETEGSVTVRRVTANEASKFHGGAGIYYWWTEYPEEGCDKLGDDND